MVNILLCGGSGTRLWPLSRTMLPKQFVRLFDNRSLFQETLNRNSEICQHSLIVSNTEQYFLALDQLQQTETKSVQFLLEPVGRNTAPAIALACMALDEDAIVLVTTSDHLIKNQGAYKKSIQDAKNLANKDFLVTFGIKPTYPETGYGYIEAHNNDVISFIEKPDLNNAKLYFADEKYLWNSGMFCFKAGVFLAELKKYSPEIFDKCQKALPKQSNDLEIRIDLDKMNTIPDESIDYAVMEKSKKVKVVPCDIDWSDLGSFDALYDEIKTPGNQNAILQRTPSSPEPICIDSFNNLVIARDRQIALVDIEDLLVIDTSDAILVSKKGSSQKVKNVVAKIKKNQPEMAEIHRLAHRPWGSYEVLIKNEGYKVKRIQVKPGGRLSLQKHFHRNEHWIVVSGTATVTVDGQRFLVRPNESTYIKMGQVHRLENDGKIDLIMVEVQVGEYTGEDDIERIQDIYGRDDKKNNIDTISSQKVTQ